MARCWPRHRPRAHDSIPQLLLTATTEDQEGVFKGVSFVQRLRTVGGLPPDYGCDEAHVGAKLGRQYSAYYLFYKPLGVTLSAGRRAFFAAADLRRSMLKPAPRRRAA